MIVITFDHYDSNKDKLIKKNLSDVMLNSP